jgi:DNA polymerase-3 subunit beta
MHITCQRRDLYRALRLLSHAISTRSTLPILQNVLIEAPGTDRLRLAATNLQIGIVCSIEALVEQDGSITVPALPLLAFLREPSDAERATLVTEDAPLLKDQARTFMLVDDLVAFPCMDAAGFPPVKSPAESVLTVGCPARLLSEAVAQVAFAASPDTSDSTLSNVWLQVDGKIATFAASNGLRCALRMVSGIDIGA